MTRVLVYGGSDIEDPSFVHNALTEANRIHGPFSCVIHANHAQALAWQQWAARRQVTRHLPIVADWKDGVMVHARHRDRLFDLGKPEVVIVFQSKEKREPVAAGYADAKDAFADEQLKAATKVIYRAETRGLPVLTFAFDPKLKHGRKDMSLDSLVEPPSLMTPETEDAL